MYRLFLACTLTCFLFLPVQSQNVGIGTATPNNNAVLDIQSTSKGILIPRMDSTTRKLIPNVPGLLVYDSTTKTLWQNTGIAWENYYIIPKGINSGDMLYWNGTQWVLLPTATTGKILTVTAMGLPVWQNPAPILHSIGVTPAAPTIIFGQTQQFAATGIYWDSTMAEISSSVTWKSSNTSVATVNSSGLVTSTGAGSTTITARIGVISGSSSLVVTNTSGPFFLSINDVSLSEGNSGSTIFNFTVNLSAVSGQTITVNYSTANGTATNGGGNADYIVAFGSLTFVPGETTKNIAITVNGDVNVEANETFLVNLTGPVNAIIVDGQGLGTILNDD